MSDTSRMTPYPSESAASPAEEQSLVAALKAGDAIAFDRLVRDYGGRLLSVARRMLSHEEDAREVLQETFASAFRAIKTFDGQSLLSTWLHRITVNAALMRLRRRQRKPEKSIDDFLPTFVADGHRVNPGGPWSTAADHRLERAETRELVRKCIDMLPEAYRTVLVLRDLEEIDTAETARLLNVSEGVVKTRLHRARQALRTLLDPHFAEEKGSAC